MADLSITASQVLPGSGAGAQFGFGIAGSAITAGQPLYADESDSNKLKPADNNASEATANCIGIALNGAATGQPVKYQKPGADMTLGAAAAMTQGTIYILSATAGGICPAADLASGNYVTILGVAVSASVLRQRIVVSGVQK